MTAAVEAAGGDGGVIALFVVDPVLWDRAGANRRWFLHGCLVALDEELGAAGNRLVVRHGDPATIVPALAVEHDVTTVFHSQDVGVYGRRRDAAVATTLAAARRELVEAESPWVVAPGSSRTSAGGAFKVFTPFHRRWRQHRLPRAVAAPTSVPAVSQAAGDELPAAPVVTADLPTPGAAAGHVALEALARYARTRP